MPRKSILSACALDGSRFVLLCADVVDEEDEDGNDEQEMQRELIFVDDGKIIAREARQGELVKVSKAPGTAASFVVLTSIGGVEFCSSACERLWSEDITGAITAGGSAPPYGFIDNITLIEDALYACGMGGQIYVRRSSGQWELVSQNLCSDDIYTNWFSNIQGTTARDIFIDGLSGVLYHFDGFRFSKLETGTDAPLGEILFRADKMYVAGGQSVLVVGSPTTGFEALKMQPPDLSFYTIADYEDNIFLGCENGLMRFDPRTQSVSRLNSPVTEADVFSLQRVGDVLWCFGKHLIFRFDGVSWTRLDHIL